MLTWRYMCVSVCGERERRKMESQRNTRPYFACHGNPNHCNDWPTTQYTDLVLAAKHEASDDDATEARTFGDIK